MNQFKNRQSLKKRAVYFSLKRLTIGDSAYIVIIPHIFFIEVCIVRKEGVDLPKSLKVDITDKVIGKFKDGYIELYSSKYLIGKFFFKEMEQTFQLAEGYVEEDGRFYLLINLHHEPSNVR